MVSKRECQNLWSLQKIISRASSKSSSTQMICSKKVNKVGNAAIVITVSVAVLLKSLLAVA